MAKYLTIFLIIAILLAGFFTFFYSKESYKIFPLPEEQNKVDLTSYNFQDWHEFHSPNKEFTVLLPNLPQHAKQNLVDQKTQENRKYEMFVSQKSDGSTFMISLITFPENKMKEGSEKVMREMMDEMMAANPSNELHQVKLGTYQTYPSLEYSFGNKELRVDAKSFIIDSKLYILSRVVSTPLYNANEYNFFINSFELTSPTKESSGDSDVK